MIREKKGGFQPLSIHEIQPKGWLRRQLEIQAAGLAGNLDQIWPDVRDSRWIGGDREGWERVPYWLDGFIPLAWLLKDADMQRRAKRYVDAILDGQQADGWICPCTEAERPQYDVWAALLICKVLMVYHDCTGDARVEEAVYRALRQLNDHLDRHTLFNWGHARWFEGYIPLFWLYDRRPEDWMPALAHKLRIQGMDWRTLFADWRYQQPGSHGEWTYMTHVVNLAMALKAEALLMRVEDTPAGNRAWTALSLLLRDHGMACSHFTGDECLSGLSPLQGTELCGVVEAMYSYEHLLAATGEILWGDMLERLAFNALPATTSPDMWTHQYVQMTNQVQCTSMPRDHVVFRTNNQDAHLFGLEPHYGCCTANMGQGWPKFALSTVMRAADGLAITAIAPCQVETTINGVPVICQVGTEYPFRDGYAVTITPQAPVTFAMHLRVPGFASAATVEGNPVSAGSYVRIEKTWDKPETIHVALAMEAKLTPRPDGMVCLNRGPLLYAVAPKTSWLPVEYIKNGVERKAPYCDYHIKAESPWQYAFAGQAFAVRTQPVGDTPFSPDAPPIVIDAAMAPLDWEIEYGRCKPRPTSADPTGPAETVTLIPYGCTTLRLTETLLLDQ